jgi:hypothetical protein
MDLTQATDELYPLLDMHRQHLAYIDSAEVRRLRSLGVVVGYGTRKRTHGYQLTVSTTKVGTIPNAPWFRPTTAGHVMFSAKG